MKILFLSAVMTEMWSRHLKFLKNCLLISVKIHIILWFCSKVGVKAPDSSPEAKLYQKLMYFSK